MGTILGPLDRALGEKRRDSEFRLQRHETLTHRFYFHCGMQMAQCGKIGLIGSRKRRVHLADFAPCVDRVFVSMLQ